MAAGANARFLDELKKIGWDIKDTQHHSSLNRASVLVPLFFVEERPFLLLNLRSQKLKSHKGEVCFPGGKQDPEDGADDIVTALREAQEEVGLDPALVHPLCRLRTLESVNHLCVTPIVGMVADASTDMLKPCNLELSEMEVEAAFWCPLDFFVTEPAEQVEMKWSQEMFIFRKYIYKESPCGRVFSITGLTAHIAHEVAKLYQVSSSSSSESIGIGLDLDIGIPGMPLPHDALAATTAANSSSSSIHVDEQQQQRTRSAGYLYKQERSTATNRPYWTRKFFLVTDQVLHQYDSGDQAQKKAWSATKKNRLVLHDAKVVIQQQDDDTDTSTEEPAAVTAAAVAVTAADDKHTFQVSVLDGRIVWVLAAGTREERARWKEAILSRTYSSS